MQITITLLITLLPYVLAKPLKGPHKLLVGDSNPNPNWTAAPSSAATCPSTSSKVISWTCPKLETVLNNACAAIMPPCAYPQRLGPDTFCVQTIDFALTGKKSTVQTIDEGNVAFSVTPLHTGNKTSAGVFWTKADCYGYFAQIVSQRPPFGCQGSGVGSLTVGGTKSLNGTVFNIELVGCA